MSSAGPVTPGGGGPPAGWYADPSVSGASRWWDGRSWTPYAQVVPPRPGDPWFGASPANPTQDLVDEIKASRWAVRGLWISAAAYLFEFVAIALTFAGLVHRIRVSVDQAQQSPSGEVSPFNGLGRGYYTGSLILQLLSLVVLAGQVLFLIWVYRAATFAQRAGIPARRSPAWAVLGFFIPVVNLWFPYRSLVDVFPASRAGSGHVGLWWTLTLLQGVALLPIVIAAAFSISDGIVAAVIVAALPVLTAVMGTRMIRAAGRAHQEVLNHLAAATH